MLLYDTPLSRQSVTQKCLTGSLVHSRLKMDPGSSKLQEDILLVKSTSFQLYSLVKSDKKKESLELHFCVSQSVYGEICNAELCPIRIEENKSIVDVLVLTLCSGENVIYYYDQISNRFALLYKDLLFKTSEKQPQLDINCRHIGNYITSSEMNHLLISSVRNYHKLYFLHASVRADNQKLAFGVRVKDEFQLPLSVVWSIIWLPPVASETNYSGKYIILHKKMTTLSHKEQSTELGSDFKTVSFFYIEKGSLKIDKKQDSLGLENTFWRVDSSAHLLIPAAGTSFFILTENKICLRQIMMADPHKSLYDSTVIETPFLIREALVDKNIRACFSVYSRSRNLDSPFKMRLFLMNQFGDLFKLEYTLTSLAGNIFVANFSISYLNTFKTTHSLIYVGDSNPQGRVQWGKDGQLMSLNTGCQTTLLLFGFERYNVGLYFLIPPKYLQNKPKEIKVSIRSSGKSKTNKTYPEISQRQSYKPISQKFKDFQIVDEIQSSGTIVDLCVSKQRNGKNVPSQLMADRNIYLLTNGGNLRHEEHIDQTIQNPQTHKSYLKIIKKGLKVSQRNSIIHPKPLAVYSFKKHERDEFVKLIVLCTSIKTSLFIIGEKFCLSNYKELPIEQAIFTLYMGKFTDDSFVQVSQNKIRHLRRGTHKELNMKGRVEHAVCLGTLLFVGLYGGEVICYEIPAQKESLQQKKQFYVHAEVVALELSPLEALSLEQKFISKFLIVATKNYEIQIYRIRKRHEKELLIEYLTTQKIKEPIRSVCCLLMTPQYLPNLKGKTYFVYVGLMSGSVIKIEFDENMKKQSTLLHKNISNGPAIVQRTFMGNQKLAFNQEGIHFEPYKRQTSVLITTGNQTQTSGIRELKSHLIYLYKNKELISPLAHPGIDMNPPFSLPQAHNVLATHYNNYLRFMTVDSFGEDLHDEKVQLFISGKKMIAFDNFVGIIQSDPSYEKLKDTNKLLNESIDLEGQNNKIQIQDLDKIWKSQFTIHNIHDRKKVSAIYFDQTKENCLCAGFNRINTGPLRGEYLIFGCAKGLKYYPKYKAEEHSIKIYAWNSEKSNSQFLYQLSIEDVPLAIQPCFKGQKFLIGVGSYLRLYEVGKKKLLLKAETKLLKSRINSIKTVGKKIFVTCVGDSCHLFKYIPQEHTFYDVASDLLPKYVTAMNVLDSQSVCLADKFGNLIVARLTESSKNQFDNTTAQLKPGNSGNLCSFNILASINVGDIVTAICKARLGPHKNQVIIYSTVMGQLRVLSPLDQFDEVKVIPQLQEKLAQRMGLRRISSNNYGRRKNVIKGQIIQSFLQLSEKEQLDITQKMKLLSVEEIKELIQNVKNKLF